MKTIILGTKKKYIKFAVMFTSTLIMIFSLLAGTISSADAVFYNRMYEVGSVFFQSAVYNYDDGRVSCKYTYPNNGILSTVDYDSDGIYLRAESPGLIIVHSITASELRRYPYDYRTNDYWRTYAIIDRITKIKMKKSNISMGLGSTKTLDFSLNTSDNFTKENGVMFSTSDSDIVSIDGSGKMTAKAYGTVTIKVISIMHKNVTASCNVTVTRPAAKGVTLNKTSLTLGAGEKYKLTAKITPSNANKSVKWSSSNTSVATVSGGTITAKKSGTTNIKVTTASGKSATCKLTVKPGPKSVKINPSKLTLGKGETYTISESTNSGSYANADNLKWSSSNSSVATVKKGSGNKATITAKGTGSTNIKITLFNGKTATCKLTVKSAPSSVKINPSKLTLGKGETYTISESTNSGSYSSAANLKWSSSDSSVATVKKGSGNKATITAKGTGSTNIKITLFNGKTATCKVTVKSAPSSVKTNPTSLTLGKGETYTISENTNSGSYANAANLKWSTTNSSVATVKKSSGNKATITAKGTGTAYIKIKLFNGKTAQCKVTVKPAPTSVKMKPSSVSLYINDTYTISENTNSGSYANAANLKWSSSNSNVAAVKKGNANKAVITGKSVGTATVKVTLYNGKTATCKVTVKAKEIVSVSSGCAHCAYIDKDGNLFMWGNNIWGMLGDGTTTDRTKPVKVMSNIKSVSLGAGHSAAITKNGDLYTWGANYSGQLGDGTTTEKTKPIKVMSNVKSVSLGGEHSAAITENGDLYLWGVNDDGQLGDGTTTDRTKPVKIMSNVKAVSLGQYHSAAITENGDLYTWGDNYYGQLGDGTTTDRTKPAKIISNVKAVSLGEEHSAAITENGDLYTWGANYYRQLGDETPGCCLTPIRIMSKTKSVSLGDYHSAAITENGDLYLWGVNDDGQLGDGTTTDRTKPVKIMSNIKSVSLGSFHSAAISKNGDIYTWGDNSSGQLGDGTSTDEIRTTPALIYK